MSTALPTIIGDLDGSQSIRLGHHHSAAGQTASTPIWGKLADLFNKKLLVQSAIVIFVIGSVIAGVAGNRCPCCWRHESPGHRHGRTDRARASRSRSIVSPRERGRYSGYWVA